MQTHHPASFQAPNRNTYCTLLLSPHINERTAFLHNCSQRTQTAKSQYLDLAQICQTWLWSAGPRKKRCLRFSPMNWETQTCVNHRNAVRFQKSAPGHLLDQPCTGHRTAPSHGWPAPSHSHEPSAPAVRSSLPQQPPVSPFCIPSISTEMDLKQQGSKHGARARCISAVLVIPEPSETPKWASTTAVGQGGSRVEGKGPHAADSPPGHEAVWSPRSCSEAEP